MFLLVLELAPNKEADLPLTNKSVSSYVKPVSSIVPKYVYKPYVQFPKILIFQGKLSEMGRGQLLLLDTKTAKVDGVWMANSGIGASETAPARGPVPSNWRLPFKHYQVSVKPLWITTPGVDGWFYQITPFNFNFAGVNRGDFGIHRRRANGTLGCIGIDRGKDWESIQKLMTVLAQSGIKKIPLLVSNY